MVIAIANTKGGTGKSTTAALLALELDRRGRGPVLLVDADPGGGAGKPGSVLTWAELAGQRWPLTTVGLPVRDLANRLAPLLGDPADAKYKYVVIDTPPQEIGIVLGALRCADQVLVPLAPTPIDFNRLAPTLQLLADAEQLRELEPHALLTCCDIRTSDVRVSREWLGELRLDLIGEIPARVAIARAFGTVPPPIESYSQLCDRLLEREACAA